jgi:choice-of-anchor A domain-containing protein
MIGRRFSKLVAATGLLLTATAVDQTVASAATTSTVSGTVFRDDDYSGTKGTRERGQGGIVVKAYDSRNALVGTTTSATKTGMYTVPVSAAYTGGVRVHFEIPASFSSLKPAGHSAPIDQFVDVTSAAATGVDFALTDPRDYCQSNPKMLSACWKYGDQSNNRAALVSYSANSVGIAGVSGYTAPRAELTENQIGTTFGAAYSNNTSTLFVSAYERRHAGFGPAGTGGIYKVMGAGATATVSTYADLNVLFGAGTAGANTHPAGASGANSSTGTASAKLWWHDINSYDAVGKVSLGGMKLSTDQSNLFVVNLADRQLYRMSATVQPTSAAQVQRVTIPAAGDSCPASDSRPFGLGFRYESGYVGVVCTAQTSQDSTKLRGYIYRFDPVSMAFDASPVVTMNLKTLSAGRPGSAGSPDDWKPWTSVIPASGYQDYSQAMISDIVFDGDDMVIGLRDRFGDQLADGGGNLTAADTGSPVYLDAWGDILRACASGSGWTIESAGSCGGVSSGRTKVYSGGGSEAMYSNGSLFQIPGAAGIMTSSMDPASNYGYWDHTGMATISHTTGQRTAGYGFTAAGVSTANGLFGKGNGMGALAAMCDKAPLEVGGRVWSDTNGSGVQDAGEAALPNVSVNLLSSAGAIVGSAVSDAKGLYSFSNKAATSTASSIYGIASLTPDSTGWKVQAILTDPDIPAGLFPTSQGVAADDAGDVTRSSVIGYDGRSEAFAVGGSAFINQALGMGLRSVLADCTTSSIGRSINRALLVSGNATLTGLNTTGSVGVGGSITMSSGAVATGLPVDSSRIDLAGNNSITTGSSLDIARGNYSYANSKSGSAPLTAGSIVGKKQSAPWIASAFTTAQTASTFWAAQAMPGTSTVTITDPAAATKTFRFTGTLATVNVFTITRTDLQTAKHIDIDIPKGSLAVINVTGGSTFTTSAWLDVRYVGASAADPADARSGLSWNFVGTSTLTLAGPAPEGLVLAPSAALVSSGSTLKGSAVVSTVTSAGSIQFAPSKLSCISSSGPITVPPPPPEVLDTVTTAGGDRMTCNAVRGDWTFTVTGMTTPPNTISVNWVGGEAQTITRRSWTDAGALYTSPYSASHQDLAGTPVASGVGAGARLAISGNCVGSAPTMAFCLEGTVGAKATGGKFDYQFPLDVIATDSYFVNTITVSDPAPALTHSATTTRSGSFALATTWSVAGTYSNGHIMPAASISLPAAGADVTVSNACELPTAEPLPNTLFPT